MFKYRNKPLVIMITLLWALLGCQKEGILQGPTPLEDNGKVFVGFSLKVAREAGASITRVNVLITKDAFADSLDLSIQGDSASGTFTNLVPGTYAISVKLYEGTNFVGSGSGQGTVVAGQTTTVRITITLYSGNLQIIVDWNITSSITLSGREIKGLAYDSGVLWLTHSPTSYGDSVKISKMNPVNGQILLESSQFLWNGRGITVGAGFLWIADALSDVIRRIDTTNFSQISSFSTPGSEPTGITFDGTNLWLVDPYFQKIYKLNTTGGVISNFTIPNAFRYGLEWESTGMWTNTDTNKVSFYTTSGTITSTKSFQLPTGYYGFYDIAIGSGKVYISSRDKIFIQSWP